MNIGVFDSGLGGLIITKALIDSLPEYNFCYLGDTEHVPYGTKSRTVVHNLTKQCVDYLFRKQNCKLVIIACNTATFASLRKLQQTYLPQNFPDRKILGVIVPTVEEIIAKEYKSVGLLATNGTVQSNVYGIEIQKRNPNIRLASYPAPLLVPLVENNGDEFAEPIIRSYIRNFKDSDIQAIILGCTHYPHYKTEIKNIAAQELNRNIDIISQDEFIPKSLQKYLLNHPEIDSCLTKDKRYTFEITDITDAYITQAKSILNSNNIEISKIDI